jgi:hypothetical protein
LHLIILDEMLTLQQPLARWFKKSVKAGLGG